MNTLGIFVKHPLPGTVKTRLSAEIGAERATEFYAAFIADLTEGFRVSGERRVLAYAPDTPQSRTYFEAVAGNAYELWPQPTGDLGRRMQSFLETYLMRDDQRAVLIGSDSPSLPRDYVERAFESLEENDCVVGPAADGGYYLIGQRRLCLPVFEQIDWSGPRVLAQTVSNIERAGQRLEMLPPWYDIDTIDDLWMLQGHVEGMNAAGRTLTMPRTRELLTRDFARRDSSL